MSTLLLSWRFEAMSPINRMADNLGAGGLLWQARLQDEERAVREDERYFLETGINKATGTTPIDISEEELGHFVIINGLTYSHD